MDTDRRLRHGQFPVRGLVLAWAAVCLILLAISATRLASGQFPGPDDVLRLVQVRDLLAGQGWFDVTQYRIAPPEGTAMHWSRLVDVPLLLIIAALTPALGQAAAETAAAIIVPFAAFALAAAAIGRLAWRLLGPREAVFAVLACGFLPSLLFQFQPMRIDHHGWQIACVAVTLWAISGRQAKWRGAVAGWAMAAGVTISLELLPLAAAFGMVLFSRWWSDDRQRAWLTRYMLALAAGLIGLYLATRGLSLTPYCDAVSLAHLAFFGIAGLGTFAIRHARSLRGFALVLLFAAVGAAAAAAFTAIAPQCLASPFASLPSLVDERWYRLVFEGQPVWRQPVSDYLPGLVQLAAALGAAILLHLRSRDWPRRWWAEHVFLLLSALALGLFVARSLGFAAIIAAIPLGWLASTLLLRLRGKAAPLVKLASAAAVLLLLAPNAVVMLADAVRPAKMEPADTVPARSVSASACDIYANASRLSRLPQGTVFAPLDIGPALLLETDHSVVATGHHRAASAMESVIGAFIAEPEQARSLIAGTSARYLALCTDMNEAQIYASEAPDGLAARLVSNEAPDWLERIALGGPATLAVYRIRN